jgi:hypothetical protein
LAMEVSSSSMKVARVTVSATTQGLMMGRDLGLVFELFGELFEELFGESFVEPIAESISRTAGSGSWVNTAWLANVSPPFSHV